jgi:hypothetical protein
MGIVMSLIRLDISDECAPGEMHTFLYFGRHRQTSITPIENRQPGRPDVLPKQLSSTCTCSGLKLYIGTSLHDKKKEYHEICTSLHDKKVDCLRLERYAMLN